MAIRATFRPDGFAITDHAGDSRVCAAVSMAAQMTALGIQDVLRIPCDVEIGPGKMAVTMERPDESGALLLEVLRLSLQTLQRQYTDRLKVEG